MYSVPWCKNLRSFSLFCSYIVWVRVYYDYCIFLVLRHWCVLQVLTPRMSPFPNTEKTVSSLTWIKQNNQCSARVKKISHLRPKCLLYIPFSNQNCSNTVPFGATSTLSPRYYRGVPPPPTECQMNWNHHTIHKHTLNLHKLVCGRDELYFLYFTDQKIIFKELFQIIL